MLFRSPCDPATTPACWVPVNPAHWTEYVGQQPYLDFDAEADPNVPPVAEGVMRYVGGFGTHARQAVDPNDPNAPGETLYLHGDLIGSTMLTTDATGSAAVSPAIAYTAFGEPVGTSGTEPGRYMYGGGWGYESGLISLSGVNPNLPPITLQHVGERWYQPGIGRFVQRDPIGINGGLNVYLYCAGNPLGRIDPLGTFGFDWDPRISWWHNFVLDLTPDWTPAGYRTAQGVALGVGIAAAGGAAACAWLGYDALLFGAMKVGQLVNPQPYGVSAPPGPAWDWWDDWKNDPQWWLP